MAALRGYEGKKAIILATYKTRLKQQLNFCRKNVKSSVICVFAFTGADFKVGKKLNELIVMVNASLTE